MVGRRGGIGKCRAWPSVLVPRKSSFFPDASVRRIRGLDEIVAWLRCVVSDWLQHVGGLGDASRVQLHVQCRMLHLTRFSRHRYGDGYRYNIDRYSGSGTVSSGRWVKGGKLDRAWRSLYVTRLDRLDTPRTLHRRDPMPRIARQEGTTRDCSVGLYVKQKT